MVVERGYCDCMAGVPWTAFEEVDHVHIRKLRSVLLSFVSKVPSHFSDAIFPHWLYDSSRRRGPISFHLAELYQLVTLANCVAQACNNYLGRSYDQFA